MKNQKGFTLIEIIIVIGISSLLLTALFGLYSWHQKIFVHEEATVIATNDVRMAMLNMNKYIAQADTLESSHVFSGTTRTSGGSELVLKIPSVNSSDNVIANTYDYVAFYVSNSTLYQQIELGSGSTRLASTKKLADNIYTFALTYDNASIPAASAVTVDIQTQISVRTGNVSAHVTDTIILRN